MYISPAVLSLSLCAVAQAGHNSLNDVPIQLLRPLHEIPSQNSTCPVLDISTFQASEICLASKPSTPEPSPWTNTPICSNETSSNETSSSSEFCVYTSSFFSNNRGVTFLTTPEVSRVIARLPAFSSTPQFQYADPRPPPFEVVQLPGRGMGLIANRTIERGDRIKAHPAVGIFNNNAFLKSGKYNNLMREAVSQLPSNTKDLFMAMASHDESHPDPVIEKLNTNTFGEDFGGVEHSIAVPETARLNHDCRPNAMYYFDPQTLIHYTHAARTIYAGEEITITYTDPLQMRRARRASLKRSWGFDCSCSLCTAPHQFIIESNWRITEILKLVTRLEALLKKPESSSASGSQGNVLENEMVDGDAPNVVAMAELLISLYEQERLYATISEAYRFMALAYSSVGDEYRALKWGHRAIDGALVHDGPRSAEVKEMRGFVAEVKEHWSWELMKPAAKKGCGCGGGH